MPDLSIAEPLTGMIECPMNTSIKSIDPQPAFDYTRIESAIRYLTENAQDQPELGQIAHEIGLSKFHFQRLFTRWAGISPKKFLQYLTLTHAKQRLSQSTSVLDATFDAGLSGPSRLHDLSINSQHVTPGEYKSRGQGIEFCYGFHPTPFGDCLAVESDRGLSGLSFVQNEDYDTPLAEQKRGWDQARWTPDQNAGKDVIAKAFSGNSTTPISVLMRGTPYQVRVWEALLQIPVGCTTTYGNLADKMGFGKKAARALGNACGANRIGVLIPCHRVIRDTGVVSGYRWGTTRKKAVLAFEAVKSELLESVV